MSDNNGFQSNKKFKSSHSNPDDASSVAVNQLLKVAAFHMDGALNRFYIKTGIEATNLKLFSDQPDSKNMFLLKVCKAISMFNSQIGYSHISDEVYEMEMSVFLDTVLICFLQQEFLRPELETQYRSACSSPSTCSSPTTTNDDSMSVDNDDSCENEDSVSLVDAELFDFLASDLFVDDDEMW